MKKSGIVFFFLFLILSGFIYNESREDKIDKSLRLFNAYFRTLMEHYVDELDPEVVIRKSIDATNSSLDRYTRFFDAKESEDRSRQWKGILYGGVGINLIERNGAVLITGVKDNYPAQNAGIFPGSVILAVDSTTVKGKPFTEVVQLIRGEVGTEVSLIIANVTDTVFKKLERVEVLIEPVPFSSMIDENTGYISFSHFLRGSSDAFYQSLEKLKKENKLKNLVIDLRENTGGLVDEAVKVLSFFIPDGKEVCSLKGFYPGSCYSYYTSGNISDTTLSLILLTDENTISAAEIFAGAMQDYDRAVILGRTTFGKGLVQGTRFPGYGTSLYLTAARYYTPSGRSIHKAKAFTNPDSLFFSASGRVLKGAGGVSPDIVVLPKKTSAIITALQLSYLPFDYASDYRKKHAQIKIENFSLESKAVDDFIKFAEKRQEELQLPSDKKLKELIQALKNERGDNQVDKELQKIMENMRQGKVEMLKTHKKEIKTLLEREILKRYFKESVVAAKEIKQDELLVRSMALFKDTAQYNKILKP